MKPLTPKQKKILDFISHYTRKHDFPPTQEEIRKHFSMRSLGHVQHYVVQLKSKGHLQGEARATRGLGLAQNEREIPLLGKVAAGRPIESSFHQEFFEVPRAMLKKQGDYFALKVEGDSMVDEGIFDGDFLIVKKQVDAENGQIVVAYVEGGATVKKFFNKKNHIELHPANPKYSVMRVEAEKDFRIEGLLCGVLRVFSD